MEDRIQTTATLGRHAEGWAISWGNEALLLPNAMAEAWARRILGQQQPKAAGTHFTIGAYQGVAPGL
jgi:hypothetical protein